MPRQPIPLSFPPAGPAPRPRGKPISVFTPNFHLRTMKESDASETFIKWLAAPDILSGLNIPLRQWTVDSLRVFFTSFDCVNRHLVGIEDRKTNALVGFYVIDINPTHRTCQLTAAVGDAAYVGRNVLREAGPVLVRYLFDKREVEKVSARVVATNRRVLFNFMVPDVFQFEAKLRQEVRLTDGKRADILVFSALRNP
jgi:RimJ/RimL family protein N-acetyltransferase